MNTILYDVTLYRYFSHSTHTENIAIGETKKEYIATVRAVNGDLRDAPNMSDVRVALPYNLRKAFDRAGEFYFDNNPNAHGFISLYTKKDEFIGSLVAERRVI